MESIRHYSRNSVEVIELQDRQVGPCVGCYLCDFHEDGTCVLKDEYEAIKHRLHQVDGIVLVGTCASGMVDCHLKAFLDRCWGIGHRPSLEGKYGFVVATGGGPLEVDAAWCLRTVLNKTGTRCVAALTQSAADAPGFAATLRRTVEDLDRALDEKWRVADRFGVRATAWAFRDLAAESGVILLADYKFHKEHRLFEYTTPGGGNAVLRLLFKNERLKQWLMSVREAQIVKGREGRLAAYLQHGQVGKGTEVSKY